MNIRDARSDDIPHLRLLKEPAALHEDRIRDAADREFRYLLLEGEAGRILGYTCLVFRHPKGWPPDTPDIRYPRVVDLLIREENRGQGLGKVFMRGLESVCKELGYDRLHLSVDPEGNSAALGFYRALGYRASPSVPKWRRWSFRDSKGGLHQGEGPELDMFREIR